MGEPDGDGYLSIGEVLGLLLEEFPDVTISKIRFLESQGLISPERTSSGYRKFYDDDVELLRVILTEQRQNYLPLRVIKDRLETGQIDPSGEHLRPDDADSAGDAGDESAPADEPTAEATVVPATSVSSHPAARGRADSANPGDEQTETDEQAHTGEQPANTGAGDDGSPADAEPEPASAADESTSNSSAKVLPGGFLDRGELCSVVGMTESELDQLENFGVVQSSDGGGGIPVYDDNAVEVAKPACEFLRAGIDARHLRTFRTSAEREASLYEQIITPRFRHRNPESRAEALTQLRQLDELGAKLRAALTKQALSPHLKP